MPNEVRTVNEPAPDLLAGAYAETDEHREEPTLDPPQRPAEGFEA